MEQQSSGQRIAQQQQQPLVPPPPPPPPPSSSSVGVPHGAAQGASCSSFPPPPAGTTDPFCHYVEARVEAGADQRRSRCVECWLPVYACCCPQGDSPKMTEAEWRHRLASEDASSDPPVDNTGLSCSTYLSFALDSDSPASQRRRPAPPPFHLIVFMHHKEYYRSSNTAIALRHCLPTALVRGGVQADERWMLNQVRRAAAALPADKPKRLAVLYPREGESVSLASAMAQTLRAPDDATVPLLVVVDGTWNNVRSLVKRLDKLLAPLQVATLYTQLDSRALSPAAATPDTSSSTSSPTSSKVAGASSSYMRSQVAPGRVTTAEAVAAAAVEVARSASNNDDGDGDDERPFVETPTSSCIRDALQVRVSSFTAMAGGASRFDRKREQVQQKLQQGRKRQRRQAQPGVE